MGVVRVSALRANPAKSVSALYRDTTRRECDRDHARPSHLRDFKFDIWQKKPAPPREGAGELGKDVQAQAKPVDLVDDGGSSQTSRQWVDNGTWGMVLKPTDITNRNAEPRAGRAGKRPATAAKSAPKPPNAPNKYPPARVAAAGDTSANSGQVCPKYFIARWHLRGFATCIVI